MVHTPEEIEKTLAAARRRRGLPVWAWLAVLAVLGGGGYYGWTTQQAEPAIAYETESATQGDLTVVITATGTVEPTTEVEISSELSGTLASVEVDYNDVVTRGQVLARLDTGKLAAQLANAEAQLVAAGARVTQALATEAEALSEYETAAELDRRGVSTHQSYISAKAGLDRARAALEIARADVTLAEANLALQRADMDKAVIRSPIDGIVLDRAVTAGQIIAATMSAPTLFTLAEDLRHMELQVDVDEADIGRVQVGNPAMFSVDAYPGRSFPAAITALRFAPEHTDDVVTYKGTLSVDNSDLLLRPGMTATAVITVAEAKGALLVPNAALRFAPPMQAAGGGTGGSGLLGLIMPRPPTAAGAVPDRQSVWVLRGGVPVEVAVEPGDSDGKYTVILSGNLAVGETVITDQKGTN